MLLQDTTLNSPIRQVKARVELYNNSYTLVDTYYYNDAVQSITIERVGDESKFFGFGVTQKATVKLIDITRQINITKNNFFMVAFDFGLDGGYEVNSQFPEFYVEEITRDEKTNELTIVGYDVLYKATQLTLNEIGWKNVVENNETLTLEFILEGIGYYLNNVELWIEESESYLSNEVLKTPIDTLLINLEGSETLKEVLDDIAEYTGTFYYIDNMYLRFGYLPSHGSQVTVTKANYFSLETEQKRELFELIHATQLGDNISVREGLGKDSMTIWDNAFFTLREVGIYTDLYRILTQNIRITNEFNMSWRGSCYLEIGDKLLITTKDGSTITGYLINDVIEYNGGYKHTTSWHYKGNDNETAGKPTNISEAIKYTYAKVDKVNKQIDLVVSEVDSNNEDITSLQMTTKNISATIKGTQEDTIKAIDNIANDVNVLTSKVEATMSSEDVKLTIKTELENNGASKIVTTTGFTFDEDGLTVTKNGAQMKTQITEDGMTVYRDSSAVLKADNSGVKAENLRATTYLIIGDNSRFENYGSNRTGCFWIGN